MNSTMEFSSMFVDHEFENTLMYVKMLFGSPGEESLRWESKSAQTTDRLTDENGKTYGTEQYMCQFDGFDAASDFEVDSTACLGPLLQDQVFETDEPYFEASSFNYLPMNEPKDFACVSVANDFLALMNGGEEDSHGDSVTDIVMQATFPVVSNGGGARVRQISINDRKTVTNKRGAVSGGIRKLRPKTVGQPFRVLRLSSEKYESVFVLQRCTKSVKGLTMCLRTLLRQLLAGSGWIVKAGVRKDDALALIKKFIGPEIASKVQVELPVTAAPHLIDGWRENHYTHLIADIISLHSETKMTSGEVEKCFTLYSGSYTPSPRLKVILAERQWPPCMPSDAELRACGCYRS